MKKKSEEKEVFKSVDVVINESKDTKIVMHDEPVMCTESGETYRVTK